MRFLSMGKEKQMSVMDTLEACLTKAGERFADLEREAEGVERRVTLAALADDAEEYTNAAMREAALPVLVNRAALALVDAELALHRENMRGPVEEWEEARARYEELHARRFTLSPNERKALGKADALMRIAQEKVRAVEAREHELLLRNAASHDAAAGWPSRAYAREAGLLSQTQAYPPGSPPSC